MFKEYFLEQHFIESIDLSPYLRQDGATVLGVTVLGATVLGATVLAATVLGGTVFGKDFIQ